MLYIQPGERIAGEVEPGLLPSSSRTRNRTENMVWLQRIFLLAVDVAGFDGHGALSCENEGSRDKIRIR